MNFIRHCKICGHQTVGFQDSVVRSVTADHRFLTIADFIAVHPWRASPLTGFHQSAVLRPPASVFDYLTSVPGDGDAREMKISTTETMNPYEKKQILTLNETLSKEIQIGVIETSHKTSAAIVQFCETLGQLVTKIRIKSEQGDSKALPAIRVHDGLTYRAVPSGTEIRPFIEALQLLGSNPPQINKSLSATLKKINLPANLIIYVSAQCKFCPQAIRQLLPLPILNRHIRLTVIDGSHFPELAAKDRVQSVPTLILEDRFRWTGTFQLSEIVDVLINRDPGSLGPASLEMMLKNGEAGRLADMMLAKAEIFPAFYDVLAHPDWPVRLGAMVVMDQLIEKDRSLALQTLRPLQGRFPEADNQVKGDLLYVFGEMQEKELLPWLQNVINGDYDAEVKEAAVEASDKLKQMK
jgi:hypothetical protein